ncbi:MAG: hypothetical protein IH628_13895 [Proteobacteria bacterium]|nr:hypothetical protein [Pseudomonadota bacterium]
MTQEIFKEVRSHTNQVRHVGETLDPTTAGCSERQKRFDKLCVQFGREENPVRQHFAKLMTSFRRGLFAGGDAADLPRDNLALERWFRQPKSHERRIHGRCHAGVRIVQEGPTLALTLDAHDHHPHPFNESELRPYCDAVSPSCQRESVHRRKVMRKARSKKIRPFLLAELEARYLESS